jgi:Tol biopolymer transport system component
MLIDQTLGPYRIVSKLGEGGMGEVYRATDVGLKRQVAIKILPPALAADPDRLARFQREAEVVASLNHPNIAAVYGLEDAAGVKALVMELVEGPTLADRIAQGAIPIEEAVPIAIQIAEALETAHAQGIVHRDLKPANIKVREDGTVKVLDFGLAKLSETASRSGLSDPSMSPTLTSPVAVTGIGMIMGTAAYMSPEQARGRAVDKRTDVWAFGAVLYEMLTGKRAFEGEDVTETMASVMKTTPAWTALPSDTPPHVVTLIHRCLEKDRNARIGDLAVARFLLAGHETIAAAPPAAYVASGAKAGARSTALIAVAVIAALATGAVTGWLLSRPTSDAGTEVTHLQMNVLPAESLVGSIAAVRPSRTAIAVSPDGRLVVFAGARGAVSQLYLRELDRADATPIPGTEGAAAPFFSPDGGWVGFWADNKIRKVPVGGGPAATICEMPGTVPGGVRRTYGASWGTRGDILFASTAGIFTVPAAGGAPVVVTTADLANGERHFLPQWLPGGEAFLFTFTSWLDWDTATIVVQPVEKGERQVLITGGADSRYVNTGYLVYMKTGTLMAAPFDPDSRTITGAPVALVEGVMQGINAPNGGDETGAGQFAVSDSGTLLYVLGGLGPIYQTTLVWVDRKGVAQPFPGAPAGPYLSPRISPDGQKVVSAVRRGATRQSDLWVYDVVRGTPTRLTSTGDNGSPVWSPDSTRVVFEGLRIISADGSGKPAPLVTSDAVAQTPSAWSATTGIVFLQRPRSGPSGIWSLPMDGGRPLTPKLFLESSFNLTHPDLSPDGRYIAYLSNESGNSELYVQSYPVPGGKTRISTAGAGEPIWTRDGRELLYRAGTSDRQQFFSVAIRSMTPFRADPPRLVFDVKCCEYDGTTPVRSWDATADGQRFLLRRRVESTDKPVTTAHIVANWDQELKRLVPTK